MNFRILCSAVTCVLLLGASVSSAHADQYFNLTTRFLQSEGKCLEGNRLASNSTLGGAAFMDNCQNVTGQMWKLVPQSNGYFRLQTKFLESQNKCLESNKVSRGATLGGAAFMDTCQNVSGQYWRIDPIAGGFFRLRSMFLESENKCLEGNRFAPTSTLAGAAFMDTCQNVTGQMWTLVPLN